MFVNNKYYSCDLERVMHCIEMPDNVSVLITGATGLIGSFIMDAFLYYNQHSGKHVKITGTSRHIEGLRTRFGYALKSEYLHLVQRDASAPIPDIEQYDYIIHTASNADPRSYALYPAETIITNIFGNNSVLEYARKHKNTRVIMTSTFEVYGYISEKGFFSEDDYGKIDFNQIRSGYPESKRTAELLVRSYVEEYGVDAIIVRLCSIYGPTMTKGDNKAVAQFIRKALKEEDIVLKSKGEQQRSYCYVGDAASGIITALCKGVAGEAYNVSNPDSTITVAELAQVTANIVGSNVVLGVPDEMEEKGFSKPKDSVLSSEKLMKLGFIPHYSVEQGLKQTILILEENMQQR